MKRVISITVVLLIFATSLLYAQISGISPRTFGDKSWRGDVANSSSLPLSGNICNDKRMVLDTKTLYIWTCTIVDLSVVASWQPGAVGAKGDKGDQGIQGAAGANGTNGSNGSNGSNGQTPTVAVNSTSTLSPGSSASVTNSGTSLDVLLDFGIPRGTDGANGADGTPRSIQDEGLALPIERSLNCVGNGIACTDDGINNRTLLTVSYPNFSSIPGKLANGQFPSSLVGTYGQIVTGTDSAGNLLFSLPVVVSHTRIVTLDSSAGGTCTTSDYSCTTLSGAISLIVSQQPASPTSHQLDGAHWTILVYPGTAGTPSDASNYTESGNLILPAQTTIQGVSNGGSGASSSTNGFPVIKFTCPSGTCLKMGGGSDLSHLYVWYRGTPTAAGQVIEESNTGSGSTNGMNIVDTEILVQPTSTTFVFDGILNSVGALYLVNSGITMSGTNTGARAIVSTDTSSSRGVTVYSGRFTGATGCITLVENAAASGGVIQLLLARIDPGKCTTELKNDGTGGYKVYSTAYTSSSGTIDSFGPTYLDGGMSLPSTPCSPRREWMDTTGGAERVCLCNAVGNAWKCVPLT